MAPKGHGKEKALGDGEDEEVLQAVILADSFNNRFKPLTSRTPRCLLPICNASLLDWTFESLALAGVKEIFVVCRSHSEQVKTAIRCVISPEVSSHVFQLTRVRCIQRVQMVPRTVRDLHHTNRYGEGSLFTRRRHA